MAGGSPTQVPGAPDRACGHSVTTLSADGTRRTDFLYHENGRGPSFTTTWRLAPDGTLASFAARGTDELGGPLSETFTVDGGVAGWESTFESGSVPLTRPAFYVPLNATCEMDGVLARAVERAGGRLDLLPAGEARVEATGDFTVTSHGRTRVLRTVTLSGLDFAPTRTWLDQDGEAFGTVSGWYACVPDGWQDTIDPLVAEGRRLTSERDRELALHLTTTPPAAGLAVIHAHLFDAVAGTWRDDQAVVVQEDRIVAVGATGRVPIPEGALVPILAREAHDPSRTGSRSRSGGPSSWMASRPTTARPVPGTPRRRPWPAWRTPCTRPACPSSSGRTTCPA